MKIRRIARVLLACVILTGLLIAIEASSPSLTRAGAASPQWSAQSIPSAGELKAESCISLSDCWAVGGTNTQTPTASTGLAEHWNGTAWSTASTPFDSTRGAFLTGISCVSDQSCVAVGAVASSSNPVIAISMTFNGSTWAGQVVAPGGPALNGALYAVSCMSVANCMAVGASGSAHPNGFTSGFSGFALILQWNGITWSTMANPDASQSGSALAGISCLGNNDCWAVGGVTIPGNGFNPSTSTLSMHLASVGGVPTWSTVVSPNPRPRAARKSMW